MHSLSTLRLYLLRVFYLVLVIGLGMQIWPAMIYHVYSMKVDSGALTCMPLLLFEITWKTAWLLTVALPHWLRGQWSQELASTTFAVGLIVVLVPLIPWSYVYECYVKKPGDRWSRTAGALASP